jgi:dihydroorotate dehydrogenase
MGGFLYRAWWRAAKLFLFLLPAESAHHFGFFCLRVLFAIPLLGGLLARMLRPRLPVNVMGLSFAGPLGLAAGFDKDARGVDALLGIGFGFVEVGTLTPRAQPGNERPRMFRLPRDRALVNRLGFNNGGVAEAVPRLRRPRRGIVGVNIGKNKLTPDEQAVDDYVTAARAAAEVADYLVVNVSSPNTPGLRALQATDALRPILIAVRAALDESAPTRRVPLLCKIAPDLADADIDAVCDLALELGLDGLVATNTSIARSSLTTPAAELEALGAGGVSGAPLKARALAVLARLRARAGDKLVLVSVGGIEDADDARARLDAGANLLQLYTGFIYGGPLAPYRIQRSLAAPKEPRS